MASRTDGESPPIRMDLWLKIAGITFSLWSLAVPIGVGIVRDSVSQLATVEAANKAMIDHHETEIARLKDHVDDLERRQRMDDDYRRSK